MTYLTSLRTKLSLPRTSWQLCLLALIGGVMSSCLIILFRLVIDYLQLLYLTQKEDYTSLAPLSRLVLPFIGAGIILLVAWFTGYKYLRTGIPFVLHRLKVAHGVIPLRNTINQFIGSAIALSAGFSVGREGPSVHLGAACSSYIGSKLALPYNSIRTLCACGIAAGISASFNTPIAAVIFVMEVILREYKVHVFIPIMLASIVGSMMTSSVFGPAHEFEFFQKIAIEFHHYPTLIALGLFLGVLAALFNRSLIHTIRYSAKYHIVPRLLLAGLITGGLGFFVPYAMGTDFSAIDFSMSNSLHLPLLVGLLFAKLVMTVTALGLGIPGGLIGPIIGIGAIAGTCAAVVFQAIYPSPLIASDFALMGMAGFMAATLNAPLAALLAVVELSNQLDVVVPAMVIIATACISSGQFFKNRSIFIMQLEEQGLSYRKPPIEKSLQRIGVLGIMKRNITLIENGDSNALKVAQTTNPEQCIVNKKPAGLHTPQYIWLDNEHGKSPSETQLLPLQSQASLADAYALLVDKRCGGVYIYEKQLDDIIGIVSFEQIRQYLRQGKLT